MLPDSLTQANHNLAKVGVEGSNPFARSNNSLKSLIGRRIPSGPSRSPAQNRTCRHAPNAGKFREAGFPSVPVNPNTCRNRAVRDSAAVHAGVGGQPWDPPLGREGPRALQISAGTIQSHHET